MTTDTQPLTVDLFLSVDGWARGETSPGYFGYFGPELEKWITTELARPQMVILGRRTYEAFAGLPEEVRDESSHRMTELNKVVFSATLATASWPNTRICRDDLIAEVGRLKSEGEVPLRTMGSLSVVRQLCGAGLVDRLRLMTFPLLVGKSGREAAFADVASADLELVDHQVLDGRVLLVEYRPTGRDIPRM
ncbi:dihydrofolate reductase family protein [Actinomadura sp. HBU206391]|uniref:dihydrofolate reductase family protein n=1 Tax=Actinomadura sp. HBU206391 TaxID=2731692 RepID=UPI001650237F|nr:dihydrofolate reductase family protein [Actinomadura sp. HBU206391]MBC6459674.1 dihydrofolate reductase family protein [Actinomadura sp. HBU206391]